MNTRIWTEQTAAQTYYIYIYIYIYMAFISPNLATHDIQFQTGDDLGSDHLPIEIEIDSPPPPPHIGTHLLTTPSTNLTRLTETFSNPHTRGSARTCGLFWTSVH